MFGKCNLVKSSTYLESNLLFRLAHDSKINRYLCPVNVTREWKQISDIQGISLDFWYKIKLHDTPFNQLEKKFSFYKNYTVQL